MTTIAEREAIVRDSTRLTQYLNDGGDPNALMREACSLHFPGPLTILLEAGADPNRAPWIGWVPIIQCLMGISHINEEVYLCLKALVEHGADVNARVDYANEPPKSVLYLCSYRHGAFARNAVQFLIDNGAIIEVDHPAARRELKHHLQKVYLDIWASYAKKRDANRREALVREVIDAAKREIVEELTAYGGPAFVALMQKYASSE